jgi:alpha-beta hydrolase superfamily lysophospholipase
VSALRRRLRYAITACLILMLFWLTSSFVVAYWFTRRARPVFDESAPAVEWGRVDSHRLHTSDGQELGAWFIEGAEGQPVVVVLHGNGACRTALLDTARMLKEEGFGVLMISLRAHGDSTGAWNDFGYSARHDVIAALEWLEKNRPERPVVIFGTSLGSAAAAFAAKYLGRRVRGYVLECPYESLKRAVRNRTEIYLPPVLDRIAYLGLLSTAPIFFSDVEQIAPASAVQSVPPETPILILAGGADRRARPDEARTIFENVRSHASLEIFEGADHSLLFQSDPARYRRVVGEFIRQAVRK